MRNFILLLIFGLAILIFGILMLMKSKRFVANSKVIKGTVIDMHKGHKGLYYPIIEYFNEEEQKMESFKLDTGTNPLKHKKGDAVELRYYSNGSKKELQLNTWFGLWGAPVLLILLGALPIIIILFSKI